jgi:hypothetical protein
MSRRRSSVPNAHLKETEANMRGKSRSDELNLPVTKQTAGGVTGAVLGGMVGGPVGAVVGGVAGAIVGEAAAEGKKPLKTALTQMRKIARAPATLKGRTKSSPRAHGGRKSSRPSSKRMKAKSHASRRTKS